MGNFFRGLLFGIGIALLIAPRRGQEQRRLIAERYQKLRGYLSRQVQSNPALQQGADKIAQTASTIKDAAVQATNQAKETAQNITTQATTQVKATAQNVTQQAAQVKETAQNVTTQATTQAKATAQNVTQQAAQVKETAQNVATQATTQIQENTGLNTPLSQIPGMEPEPQSELEAQGIHTTGQLLERTETKEMRTDLAQRIGISTHMLRTLIDRADLMRLPGIGSEMATLLQEAGVDGCKDLQRRNPEHLYATLTAMQESSKSASLTPNVDELTQWIAEATAATHSASH